MMPVVHATRHSASAGSSSCSPFSLPLAPRADTPNARLIARALERAQMTAAQFAAASGRDARTVERWLAGGTMPRAARQWLERYLAGEPLGPPTPADSDP